MVSCLKRTSTGVIIVALMTFVCADWVQAEPSIKKLRAAAQNPLSRLIFASIQNNTFFKVGPFDETINVTNVQSGIPFKLSGKWNLIARTIVPLIHVPSAPEGFDVLPQGMGSHAEFGLGDINVTGFFGPVNDKNIIWGIGPSITFPTATDSLFGSEKWSAGPSAAVLRQKQPWTYGFLVRHLWSFAGEDHRRDVNQTLIQPVLNYNLKRGWFIVSVPNITANWEADSGNRWIIPLGGGIGRLIKIGKLPISMQTQGFYNIERPAFGPDWSLRIQVRFLFKT